MRKLKLILTMLLLAVSTVALAQTKVTGRVVDESGEPIIGASVIQKGTNNGSVTDLDGNFTIPLPGKCILQISYVGYKTQTISYTGQNKLKITIKEDQQALGEVVVVGYGTQKKATLTGAVSMVNGDEVLKGRGTSNIATALQGAIPGLTITRSSSRPTSNPKINIRGGISANSSDPLILIDGVDAYSWELNTLNPNDIESISVLKDAAASIYGARAAGGVILVTTKRAKIGKISVSYNGSVTANYRGKKYPAATGSEWARMMLMADYNDTNHANGASSLWTCGSQNFNTDFYTRIMNNEAFDWNGTNILRIDPLNANQVDAVYGTTWGNSQNISVQGGNDMIQSITSLGYANDRSLIKPIYDGQKKYNFRNNTNFQIGKYVKVETGISYDMKYEDTPTYGIGYGLQDMWIFPLTTKSGKQYYDNFGGNNVLAHLTEGGKAKTNNYMLRLSGKVTFDLSFINPILNGLTFYTKGSIRQFNLNKKVQSHKIQMYTWDDSNGLSTLNGATTGSNANIESLSETNERALYQLYEFFLNYNRRFGEHNITALFGNTNELRDNYSTSIYRSSSNATNLTDLNVYDTTTDKITSSGSYKWSYVSLLGRINYDYAGKYLLEGSWRHDGSSRLVKNQRWQDFYGAEAGYRISEEKFFKGALPFVDNLKIRASWGQSGNVSTIGNYEAYAQIATGTTVMNGAKVPTSWISGITDDSRTWETVNSTNIGIDYGFLNNRLSGSFDYFWRKNNGMLINITYPDVYGGTAPSTNAGKYKTHGWELAINWNDRIGKDITYHAGFTLANAKTEVTSYAGKTSISWGVNSIIEGKPLNSLYVFKTDGLFQTQAEVDEYYARMNGNVSGSLISSVKNGTTNELTPGCVKRVDLNGDNDITKEDLYYYGDTDPHYNFSLNLGLSYKNFDFNCFFQGVGQQYNVRNGQMGCAFWSGWTNTSGYFIDKTWYAGDKFGYHTENINATYPLISRNGNRNNWNYKNYNDINVVNSWYARCKQIQIGYSLPKNLINRIGLEKLRVWVSGENLFDISNIKDGYDPEAQSNMGTYSGVDIFSSSISFGLDVTF
ncbi:SusC/RagA family TonB-linked outer membrane protein [Prevotella sp.]|uniref:SusC/RagA family TonB-linked outer membrane protein n=1 Tax=Prevotella sp. TaxID=59823 RepID=UPI003DA246E1